MPGCGNWNNAMDTIRLASERQYRQHVLLSGKAVTLADCRLIRTSYHRLGLPVLHRPSMCEHAVTYW